MLLYVLCCMLPRVRGVRVRTVFGARRGVRVCCLLSAEQRAAVCFPLGPYQAPAPAERYSVLLVATSSY
jgi:hypothetical protein